MSSSSLATTILNLSLESTTNMMPWHETLDEREVAACYLTVSVVMLPQVPVSSLSGHVERREANISV